MSEEKEVLKMYCAYSKPMKMHIPKYSRLDKLLILFKIKKNSKKYLQEQQDQIYNNLDFEAKNRLCNEISKQTNGNYKILKYEQNEVDMETTFDKIVRVTCYYTKGAEK